MMANGGLERLMANPSMRNMVRSHLLRPGRRADRFWRSGRTHAERRRNAGHRGPSERSGDAKAGRGYDGRRRRSWCRSMSIRIRGRLGDSCMGSIHRWAYRASQLWSASATIRRRAYCGGVLTQSSRVSTLLAEALVVNQTTRWSPRPICRRRELFSLSQRFECLWLCRMRSVSDASL